MVNPALSNENLELALKAVPSDTVGLLTVNSPIAFWDMLTSASILPMSSADAKQYKAELQAHFDVHVGINVSKLTSFVVAVLLHEKKPEVAAIAYPVSGALKNAESKDGVQFLHFGDNVLALRGDYLVAGSDLAVQKALAALTNPSSSLQENSEFGAYAWGNAKESYMSVSVAVDALPVPPTPFTVGLTLAGFVMQGTGFVLEVSGREATLDAIGEQFTTFSDTLLTEGLHTKDELSGEFLEGAAAISTYYGLKAMVKVLEPKRSKQKLWVELPMNLKGNGANTAIFFTSVVGILTAIAIPAFMKYIKKSKAAEAELTLHQIAQGVLMYHMEKGRLPEGSPITPAQGSCCTSGGETCAAQPALWQAQPWQDIGFSIEGEHHYVYELVVNKKAGQESFTATAYGDLDCDKDYSTFTISGSVVNGAMQISEIVKVNPLE